MDKPTTENEGKTMSAAIPAEGIMGGVRVNNGRSFANLRKLLKIASAHRFFIEFLRPEIADLNLPGALYIDSIENASRQSE
jgi:hypothetical protein